MADRSADYLDSLVRRLESRPARRLRYRVPALWNAWGFADARKVGKTELELDPRAFLLDCIRREILPRRGNTRMGGRSLSRVQGVVRQKGGRVRDGRQQRRGGDWLRTAGFYGLFVRMTTAWDHDGDGDLSDRRFTETGTFLKSILILPLLKRMGITAVYMLPVVKHSNLYRKGELGCPYSAKNFFELEPTLHDRLLSDDPADVNLEFGAFVEAAHAMGMRVLIDLAPRTAARDADWILDHPDWFYWIDRREERNYAQPYVEGADYLTPPPAELPRIHALPAMRTHRAKFRFAPNVTDPNRWARFARRMKAKPPKNLLAEIGREFGVITPPGFSDVVNDRQPPWSDVTFLRYYWDHPTAVERCLPDPDAQPPYLYSEVMKSSRYAGRKPNRELWQQLAGILPFYQRFGVDGARIDMGHALPDDLENMILQSARRVDPDFGFIAEELGIDHSAEARKAGYNMIIGPAWWMQPRAAEGRFHDLVKDVLPASRLPIWAAAETPDTPRSVTRTGGRRLARMAAAVNHFLPNAAPFINSGLEVLERQPMNLGLDAGPRTRCALKPDDPYYGKLAFFDRFVLHWGNPGGAGMVRLLEDVAAVRERFAADLADASNYVPLKLTTNRKLVLALGFRVERKRRRLIVLANTDFRSARRTSISGLPAGRGPIEVLFASDPQQAPPRHRGRSLAVELGPGSVTALLV
ncbi:MAG: hypothetical protein JXB13_10690 [Phycisphaerae bacterium]|nr:hypothetical protein [Phycisphaerae bacterium]